ncbi:hypothetical protein NDU88_000650 [Pleurodeles waltl]|uniref:Uncharacterized protein n=1 Tax=Pleurodeles waltl TaxID=8319 RepID=A0AAV7U617_PLEWA|nr:hypothetical protein NDU88_000650 [Pleurodeles waltl]
MQRGEPGRGCLSSECGRREPGRGCLSSECGRREPGRGCLSSECGRREPGRGCLSGECRRREPGRGCLRGDLWRRRHARKTWDLALLSLPGHRPLSFRWSPLHVDHVRVMQKNPSTIYAQQGIQALYRTTEETVVKEPTERHHSLGTPGLFPALRSIFRDAQGAPHQYTRFLNGPEKERTETYCPKARGCLLQECYGMETGDELRPGNRSGRKPRDTT